MGVTLSGLGSGYDWQTVVEQLRTVEEQRLTPLNTQKTNYQKKLDAWESLTTKLESLNSAVSDLKDSSKLSVLKAVTTSSSSRSADSLLTVTTGTGASSGTYNIVVSKIAKAEKLQSAAAYPDTTTALGKEGTLKINSVDVKLDGTESLADIRDKINGAGAGVTASIIQSGTSQYRLVMTSKTEGVAGIKLTDLGDEDSIFSTTPLQDGQDAAFSVDGLAMTSSTNKVTTAIPGVTLTLRGEDSGTTVGLSVESDNDAITKKIQSFVDAYNSVLSYAKEQLTYDAANKKTGGPLFGDSTLKRVKNTMQGLVSGVGLKDLGISMKDDNSLSIDSEKLSSLLEEDLDSVIEGFGTLGDSFDKTIDGFIDDIDGSITVQKKTLDKYIKNVETRLESTQELIDRKMEMYKNQFVTLDTTLYEMQNLSSYIASQIGSLNSSD